MSNPQIVLDEMRKLARPVNYIEIATRLKWESKTARRAMRALSANGQIVLADKTTQAPAPQYRVAPTRAVPERSINFRPLVQERMLRRPVYDAPGCTIRATLTGERLL